MLTLRVQYRQDDGTLTNDVLRGFVPFGDERCSALPIGDAYMRLMWYSGIVNACDADTGEVIDVRRLCGAPPPPGPILAPRVRRQRPNGRHGRHGAEAFKGQRRGDAATLLKRYGHDVIWNLFRNRLIGLFDGRCFACDSPSSLRLDHHIPLIRGGRLEPGNIIVLCGPCNTQKLDHPPEEFYSGAELAHLAPLLAQEESLLAFKLDRDRFSADPGGYLLDVGLDPLLLHEMTTNADHPWHLTSSVSVSFSVMLGPENA